MIRLCAIPGCRIRSQHHGQCADDECRGCLPRATQDGNACDHCTGRTDDRLTEIATLAPDARLVAAGLAQRGDGGSTGKPGSSPPLNDGATDVLDEVNNTITTLARDVAEIRGQRAPRPRHAGHDPIVVAARALQAQIDWIRHAMEGAEPYAIRAYAEIGDCVGKLRSVVNGPGDQKFLGPCGAPLADTDGPPLCPVDCDCHLGPHYACSEPGGCGSAGCGRTVGLGQTCDGDVYAYRGAEKGRCRTCKATVAADEREAWLDGEVRQHAFTAKDIADAHSLNVKTIRTWANRGQLKTYWRTEAGLVTPWADLAEGATPEDLSAAEVERGPRLHYVGDVLDLAAADAARRATEQAKRARRAAAKAAESEDAA